MADLASEDGEKNFASSRQLDYYKRFACCCGLIARRILFFPVCGPGEPDEIIPGKIIGQRFLLCTRTDIPFAALYLAVGQAVNDGPSGPEPPGTCRPVFAIRWCPPVFHMASMGLSFRRGPFPQPLTKKLRVMRQLRRFFISGCQRSGTTLMRLVLESHPAVHCLDEQLGYRFLIDEARGGQPELAVESGVRRVGFKIPRFAEQLVREEFVDADYGSCPSFYHGEPVLHMVRNPLDTVASMICLKIPGGKTWIELYGKVILAKMLEDPQTARRFATQHRQVVDSGDADHLVGALYWSIKNQGLFDLVDEGRPVMAVQYETLVASPKPVLRSICDFLSIPWREELLYHSRYSHGELDENGLAIGGTNPRRSIDAKSVGRYATVLSTEQIAEVQALTASMAERLKEVSDR